MKLIRRLLDGEGGFSLAEGVMALTVLAIGIALTISPVLTGLDTLADARTNQVAANLGQAQIEAIRALDYADVGFPSSSPSGVLQPNQTITVQGIDFDVTTEVEFVGSVTGLNVISGGGDGVEGAFNTGIDYKRVSVTVSDPTGSMEDVQFNTIVAPPNLAAHEGLSNIILTLSKFEPVGTPTTEVSHPLPRTCLQLPGSLTQILHPDNTEIQPFAGIDPNATDPTDPDYYYEARLGVACGLEDATTSWRIHPSSVPTADIHVAPTATADVTLQVYLPVSLDATITDENGAGLTSGVSLTLSDGTNSQTWTEADAEFDPATATFTITDFNGAPLVPGAYDITADAVGYVAETRAGTAVPAAYPTLTHSESFALVGDGGSGTTTTTGGTTTTTTGSSTTTTSTTVPSGPGPGATISPLGLGYGVAATDNRSGTGYLMYTAESVHTRFSNPPWPTNADNFIAVVYNNGWYYDDNYSLRPFLPRTSDVLVAAVDFSADTATDLVGVNTNFQGIQQGYYSGDLAFFPDQWGGGYNEGEFEVVGSYFVAWDNSGGSGGGGTPTSSVAFYVEDWLGWDINGAEVRIEGGSLPSPQTADTDAYGYAAIDVPTGDTVTVTIDSGYGHEVYTDTITVTADSTTTVTLGMPPGYGGIRYRNGDVVPIDHMAFGPKGSDILELVPVKLNANGDATVAVIADGTRWDNSGFCSDGTLNFNKRRRIDYPGQVKTININWYWDWWQC